MRSLNVLIVDDHEQFRERLSEYLQRFKGVRVIAKAKDGIEAISLVESVRPDLICMDISMPRMDGYNAARYIKKHWPTTKVVFVTVHEEEAYESAAKDVGADGFVRKSCLTEDLPKFLQLHTKPSSHRSKTSKR